MSPGTRAERIDILKELRKNAVPVSVNANSEPILFLDLNM